MRAGLIDEYEIVTHPVLVRRHTVLHRAGQLGEPEPGGDADVSRRRGPDPIRDEAMSTGRWCSRCRVGVQLVGVLIPRNLTILCDHSVGGRPSHGLSVASNPVSSAIFPSTMCRTAMFNSRYSGSSGCGGTARRQACG